MITSLLIVSMAYLMPAQVLVSTPMEADAQHAPSSALNPRYTPPPETPRWGSKITIGAGIALLIAGLSGMAFDGGCRTRDSQSRCTDPYGGSGIYPSLVVLGLGVSITGGYWYRRAAASAAEDSP